VRPSSFALLALALLAGCASPEPPEGPPASSSSGAPAADPCAGHRHATFAVFAPGPNGTRLVDMAAPRDAQGRAYYQLGIAPRMTHAVHLHQYPPPQGSPALDPFQVHLESDGACVSFAWVLDTVNVKANATGLAVSGRHEAVGQAGQWVANATEAVHFYVRDGGPECEWSERPLADLDGDLLDGQSFVVAFGAFDETSAAAMQDRVPAPEGGADAGCGE
jgi:hypothetical protein